MSGKKYAVTLVAALLVGAGLATLALSLGDRGAASSDATEVRSAADGKETRCTSQQLEHNRQLVRTFFAPGRSPQEAYDLMTPDYVQHNEAVKRFGQINGLKDREGFKAIDEILTKSGRRPELVAEPGRPKNEMASRIIANCDYVIAMHRVHLPDPQKLGAYYTVYDYDLWRIQNGKFAEHWDSQRIPTPLPELMRAPLAAR
jgi:predicted SnoaL-like aldol condensation-catalyzing enzyme